MIRKTTRPGPVIGAAVILMIVGSISLLGCICGGGGMAVVAAMPAPAEAKVKPPPPGKAPPPPANPFAPQPGQPDPLAPQRFVAKEAPAYYPVMFTLMTLDTLIGLGQLICGIALLRMSSLARTLAIWLTVVKLVLSFGSHAYQVVFVFPAQARFHELHPPPAPVPFDIGTFTTVFASGILIVMVIIQLAIVGTIILLLCTKKTREAFAAAASPTVDDDQARPRSDGYDDDGYGSPKPKSPPDTGIKGGLD